VRDARLDPADERDQPPRHIDTVRTRLDDVGWTVDRRRHVFVAAVDGSARHQVTDGPFEHEHPSWSADSGSLAFAAARHDDWDIRLAVDLWVADPSGATPLRRLTDTTLDYSRPVWSPDGTRLTATATDEREMPHHAHLVVVDVADGAVRTLTTDLDRHCAPSPGARPPIWLDGGSALLFSVEDHGNVPLLRVAADGSTPPTTVVGGERWVTGFDATDDMVVYTSSTTTEPTELFARGLDGGTEVALTSVQSEFLAAVPALAAERCSAPSPAGDGNIDGWIMRPPGFDPKQRYPMLLTIHGGPMTQYGNRWLDEVQLYASAGYVVVYCNPHGSSGDSEAWLRAIRSPLAKIDPGTGWGGVDYDDLMTVVDSALAHEPAIDPARIGVIGGSYGGFMTSWMVGHTNRFAAACSERAVNNLLTLEYTSDLAATFRHEVGVEPLEQPEEFLRQSPITYVRDIDTPVLILHSENDLRCPIEQADQLYVALRMLGKEVEYWRFPAEGHELSRSGTPQHRVERAELILDFFGRHLQPA
jgi:dipeptidyl aminopeptidase/acylaminoacyl peptidase